MRLDDAAADGQPESRSALLLALGGPADASDEVHFDRGLLRSLGLTEEVASFEKNPAALPPGSYELELSLNKVPFGAQPIRIVHDAEQRQLYCFDAEQLRQWGVLLPESAADDATAPSDCFDPLSRIPQSRIEAKRQTDPAIDATAERVRDAER